MIPIKITRYENDTEQLSLRFLGIKFSSILY